MANLLAVVLAVLLFYAYLISLRKTDETLVGITVVLAVLAMTGFTDTPSLAAFGLCLIGSGLLVVTMTKGMMQ